MFLISWNCCNEPPLWCFKICVVLRSICDITQSFFITLNKTRRLYLLLLSRVPLVTTLQWTRSGLAVLHLWAHLAVLVEQFTLRKMAKENRLIWVSATMWVIMVRCRLIERKNSFRLHAVTCGKIEATVAVRLLQWRHLSLSPIRLMSVITTTWWFWVLFFCTRFLSSYRFLRFWKVCVNEITIDRVRVLQLFGVIYKL